MTFLQSNFWILFSSTWCCVPFQFHTLSDFLLCGSNLTSLHLTQSAFSLFFLHHFSHLFFPFWLYLYECFLQGTQACSCSCSKTHRLLAHNISFISGFRRSHVHLKQCFMRRGETLFTLLQITIFASLDVSNCSTLNRYGLFSTFFVHLRSIKQGVFRILICFQHV